MHVFSRHPRKPFVGLALFGILGIVSAEFSHLPSPVWPTAALLGALLTLRFPRQSACWFLAFATFATLHACRHQQSAARAYGASLATPHQAVVRGTVASEPVAFGADGTTRGSTFWLHLQSFSPEPRMLGHRCLVRWTGPTPTYGNVLEIEGVASALPQTRNPGEFDSATWLRRQGIHFQVAGNSPKSCRLLDQGEWSLSRFALDARSWTRAQLERGLPADPEISMLISSMVLGIRGDASDDFKEAFQRTGTLHLFAVSGLNVAMLAVIAWQLLRPLRIPRAWASLIIVPFLAAYAIVVGLSASCVRASVVAAFILLAPLFARDAVPLNSLAAAAFSLLLWNTNELFNPGFQLSFALVLVILATARFLKSRLHQPLLPDEFIPKRLWSPLQRAWVSTTGRFADTVAVGLSAWCGSLFFMWGYFHLLSPVALLANLFAVPIAFFILAFGFFSLVASALFLTPLAVAVNHANWSFAKLLIAAVELFSAVPRGHLYAEWPKLQASPVCEIVALDVGDGSATHLRMGQEDWLIDTGRERDFERTVLPYLRTRGIDRLDGLILTHGDVAHVGAAPQVVHELRPRCVIDTAGLDRSPTRRALHAELDRAGLGRRFYQPGEVIHLANGSALRLLYPPTDLRTSQADDKSLVLRVEAAGRRVLLASDIGFTAEQWLRKHTPDLHSDLLVKGWASQDISGTPDFLSAVQPQAVIHSAPPFGKAHEFKAWGDELRARHVQVLDQQQHGAVKIEIHSDGSIQVATWK